MEMQKVDLYLTVNQKYFGADKIPVLRDRLMMATEDRYMLLTATEFKDPTMMLVFSLLWGTIGIDRFMVGDVGMGVLKLLTGGCCGILTIVDWFTISKRAKEVNFQKVMEILA